MKTNKVTTHEFIREMQKETTLPADECKEAYTAVFKTMEQLLTDGKNVRVTGFGEFVVKNLPAEIGTAFGNEYEKPARISVRFSPAKSMRNRMDKNAS